MTPRTRISLIAALVAAAPAALAQEVDLRITPSQTSQRVKIETRSEVTSTREIRVDGETMEGRGPSGPSTRSSEIVVEFDEIAGSEQAVERTYRTLTATASGPDGEPTTIEGGGVGKTLRISGGAERTIEVDGESVPSRLAQQVPGATSFSKLTPQEPLAVGAEFPIGPGLRTVFASLSHPFIPSATDRGDGRQPGGRTPPDAEPDTPPPDGADRPERAGGRGRDGEQRGARGGRSRGARDQAVSLLSRTTVEPEATGTVVEVDDLGIAKITFRGQMAGQGDPQTLGMGMGSRGRRGAGGEDAPQPQGDASLDVTFDGVMFVDTRNHRLQKLVIEGQLNSSVNRTMDRRGQSFEVDAHSEGTFRFALFCSTTPTEETTEK